MHSPNKGRYLALFLYYDKEASNVSTVDPLRISASMYIEGEGKEHINNSCGLPFATIKKVRGHGYLKYISLENMWKNRRTLLVNNVLRIKAEVVIFGSPVNVIEKANCGYLKSISRIAGNKFVDDMRQLFKSGRGSDVTFKCGRKAFLVHSPILRGRSLVIERMLESGMKESENKLIKIEGVDPIVFEIFLEFIYTAQVELQKESMDKIFSLVRVADKYGVEDLKDICFKFIHEHISMKNAGEIAVLSYQHNANDYFRSKIVNFCQSNWSELIKWSNFKGCVNENPSAFFDKGSRKKIRQDLEVDSGKDSIWSIKTASQIIIIIFSIIFCLISCIISYKLI